MTTTIPSTLNTSPSAGAAPTVSKVEKTAHNTPGTPVSSRQGNDRRTGHKRHPGDSAWSAAFQAAIGRQPNDAAGPSPVTPNLVSKGTSKEPAKEVMAVSAVQGGGKQGSSAPPRGTGDVMNPGNPRQVSRPETRPGAQVAKNHASRGRPGAEITPARSQAPEAARTVENSQQAYAHLLPEVSHKPSSVVTRVADIRNTHGTADSANGKAQTMEIGRSESVHSIAEPPEPQPSTAHRPIVQSAHTDEQPGLSAQNPVRLQSRHSVTKPVSVSNLQEGVTGGIQPATGPVNPHTAPIPQTSHVSSATPAQSTRPAQMLNPVSLQQLNAQIHILHQAGGGHAEIRLDPPSLGSVQIQLTLQQNQALVSFHAAQTATAQMLQASLPQLTQAMQQQGVTLTHTQIHVPSDGGGVGPNPGGTGQQPGQQSRQQQPENARVTIMPEDSGGSAPITDSESGVRAYA